MRALSIVRWILVGVIVAVLATPALAVSVGARMIAEVDGESMTPTYQVGDVIVVREADSADLKVGNVVTAIDGNGDFYTHRIITANADGSVSLKGDGNSAADPGTVSLDSIRGVVELHLGQPWAFLLLELQQWPLRICMLAVILGLALIPLGGRRKMSAPPAVKPEPLPATAEARSGRRRAERPAAKRRDSALRGRRVDDAPRRGSARRTRDDETSPIRFRSSYSNATAVSTVEPVAAPKVIDTQDAMLDAASPATGPAPLPSLDAALYAPVTASGAGAHAVAMPAQALDVVDDVDAVDDLANVVPVSASAPGYAITVVDGPDGQPRVRISVDLDSLALAAALAVAAPSPVVPGGPTESDRPASFTPVFAAAGHATAGVTPPIDFGAERGRRAKPRHGRRRAS